VNRFVPALLLLASFTAFSGEPSTPPPADPIAAAMQSGRELFRQKQYVEALDQFALALTLKPEDREAAFLAGLSAYWSRRPGRALEFWNELLDTAPRKSMEEWKLETHRLIALLALKQSDAADAVIERIYELRRKLPELKSVPGFTREHIFLRVPPAALPPTVPASVVPRPVAGVAPPPVLLRVGAWEVFDDKHESQHVWQFLVRAQNAPDEPLLRTLLVSVATLPGGEAGFLLDEELGGTHLVYKRWLQKPTYADVRPLVIDILGGRLAPIEGKAPETAPVVVAKPPVKEPDRTQTNAELVALGRIQALALAPEATRILAIAAKLVSVDLDVTKLTRLSLTDTQLATRYLNEMKAKAPQAQEDAAELIDLINKAQAEHLVAALSHVDALGKRSPYLDYSILTGLNTRGRDCPTALLVECIGNADPMVRQTAALLLARAGDRHALRLLFKEVETSDAIGCSIVSEWLSELIGPQLGEVPLASRPDIDDALAKWKKNAAQWWSDHDKKLKHNSKKAADEPYWK
jgi:tetratricopeptide (TPR) repeat protein